MISYKDLGFVNTKEMFQKAMEGKYAVPAYNFNNMEQIQAIMQACLETQSPVILQVSSGARKYADQTLLQSMRIKRNYKPGEELNLLTCDLASSVSCLASSTSQSRRTRSRAARCLELRPTRC